MPYSQGAKMKLNELSELYELWVKIMQEAGLSYGPADTFIAQLEEMLEDARIAKFIAEILRDNRFAENVALKRIKEAAQRVADDESEGLIHFAVIGELRDALLAAEEQADETE